MALQDLTPQLRTRLSRVERAVGWFVLLAMALLAFGFSYYLYNTAQRKGWFKKRVPYYTMIDRSTGLRIGDPVMLMGFEAGRITDVQPLPPDYWDYNVYVEFEIMEPNYGYMWTKGSRTKVNSDLLGKRVLEVTKGTGGYPTYVFYPFRQVSVQEVGGMFSLENWKLAEDLYWHTGTNLQLTAKAFTPIADLDLNYIASLGHTNLRVFDTREERKHPTVVWDDQEGWYKPFSHRHDKPYWLMANESPAVSERAEKLVAQVEAALPGILDLTNKIAAVLDNTASMTSNFNSLAVAVRPVATNLATLSSELALLSGELNRPGAIGELLLPTNINQQVELTLLNVNTNFADIAASLYGSLENLAGITSNLNHQVQANTNMLKEISDAIVHADELVQGLKRHWLLRSAFKEDKGKSGDKNHPDATESRVLSPRGGELLR